MPEVYKVVHVHGSKRVSVACTPSYMRVEYIPNVRVDGYKHTPVLVFDTFEHAEAFANDINVMEFWGMEIWMAAAMPDPWYVDSLCGQADFNVVQWWSRAEYRRQCSSYATPEGTMAASEIILRQLVMEVEKPWHPSQR